MNNLEKSEMQPSSQIAVSTPDGQRVVTVIEGARILSDAPPSAAALDALSDLVQVTRKRFLSSSRAPHDQAAGLHAHTSEPNFFEVTLQLLAQGHKSRAVERLVNLSNQLLADARRLVESPCAATPGMAPDAIRLALVLRDHAELVDSLRNITDLAVLSPEMARRVLVAYQRFA